MFSTCTEHQAENGQLNSAFKENDYTDGNAASKKEVPASPNTSRPAIAPRPDLSKLDPTYGNMDVQKEMKTEVKIEDLANHIETHLIEHEGFRQEYSVRDYQG